MKRVKKLIPAFIIAFVLTMSCFTLTGFSGKFKVSAETQEAAAVIEPTIRSFSSVDNTGNVKFWWNGYNTNLNLQGLEKTYNEEAVEDFAKYISFNGQTLAYWKSEFSSNTSAVWIQSDQIQLRTRGTTAAAGRAKLVAGSKVKFSAGFKFLTSADGEHHWSDSPLPGYDVGRYCYNGQTLTEDYEYLVLSDLTLARIKPDGSALGAPSISNPESDEGYYKFDMEFDLLVSATDKENAELTDINAAQKIKFNGYTIEELNDASQNSAMIHYSNRLIRIWIKEDAQINGANVLRSSGDNFITIADTFETPSKFLMDGDFTKYYYPSAGGWADEYTGRKADGIVTHVESVSPLEADGDGNTSFVITFREDCLETSVHMGAIPLWLYTTPFADNVAPTLVDGTRQAVWNGIYFDGKTVLEYMNTDPDADADTKSLRLAVHFENIDGKGTIRFSFQGTLNPPDITEAHTFRLDKDVFYTNTGAYLDEDIAMDFVPGADEAAGYWKADIAGVTMNFESKTLDIGGTVNLEGTIYPYYAEDPIIWSSSDTSVATVADGVVTAVKAGTAVITASAGTKSATCQLTIYDPATGITLNKTIADMKINDTLNLTAAIAPATANQAVTFTWTTSDSSIATVGADGVVTAKKAGTVTITAAFGDFTADCVITITEEAGGCGGCGAVTGIYPLTGGLAALLCVAVLITARNKRRTALDKTNLA